MLSALRCPSCRLLTTQTSYLYGLTDAALIPGQKYALRVRALDTEGRAMFKNQGYSEVCSFTYGEGDPLAPPDGIRIYTEEARKALVNWHLAITPESYRVQYRRKADQDEQDEDEADQDEQDDEELSWFGVETSEEQVVLRDLEPETSYEVRVASLFSGTVSRYSSIESFTTPALTYAACGAAPPPPITASTIPLTTAIAGQYWQVGDFRMQVRQVRGGDGVYSGWGVMEVPYLGVQLPVKFEKVWVDEEYNLVRGEVIALSEGVDGFRQRWQQEESDNSAVAEGQDGSSDDEPVEEVEIVTVTVEGEVVEVYVNEEGQVVAVDQEGNEEVVAEEVPEEGQALAVTDSNGNSFTVDSGGSVSNNGSSNSDASLAAHALEQRLLSELLEDFDQNIALWLENHEKGPLDEQMLRLLQELPPCLPAESEELVTIHQYIERLQADIAEAWNALSEESQQWFSAVVEAFSTDDAPLLGQLSAEDQQKGEEIVCELLLKDQDNSQEGMEYNFFVSDNNAWYREKEAPYHAINPEPKTNILAQGLQVSVLEIVKDSKNKEVAKIKLKSTEEIEYTTQSNLSQVKKLSSEFKYKMTIDYTAIKLPYSPDKTAMTYKKDESFIADMGCGDYVRVKNNKNIEGYWILKSAIKKVPNDNTDNFDWMTDIDLDKDKQVSEEVAQQIAENRNKVNDRTDKEVFGKSVRISTGGGHYYLGKTGGTPNFSGTTFEKEVKTEIYNEIGKEGGVGAINTYDDEIFTWGKGFAVKGLLMNVIEELLNSSGKDYKQLFANAGIIVVNKNFWVVDDSGNWIKDDLTSKSYKASQYIASSPQLLNFFTELAEKGDYTQDVLNAQVEVFTKQGAGKYPSYIMNSAKTAYADNWSHESVTVLAHLSHWSGHRWSEGTDRYKDTKGGMDKIIYKYLYNSAKRYSSLRIGSALTTGIYRWNTSFNVMDRLRQFGNPESAGLNKLNSTWSSHTIEIKFIKDKNDVLRAKKSDEVKYIANEDCILIKEDTKHLVITKDAATVTYKPFEPKN